MINWKIWRNLSKNLMEPRNPSNLNTVVFKYFLYIKYFTVTIIALVSLKSQSSREQARCRIHYVHGKKDKGTHRSEHLWNSYPTSQPIQAQRRRQLIIKNRGQIPVIIPHIDDTPIHTSTFRFLPWTPAIATTHNG